MKEFDEIKKEINRALITQIPVTSFQELDKISTHIAMRLWDKGCLCPIKKETEASVQH